MYGKGRKPDGEIDRYKARLVAKGYAQQKDIDYEETFAPTCRMTTVRFLCALAAHFGWDVHQSDIVTAFLNGDIFEEVYVTQPRGFVKKGQENKVCKCHKALYGLKQSPRAWYEKADTHLVKRGFRNSPIESTLYVKREGDVLLIVVLYVDDLLITGPNEGHIAEFKADLNDTFKMKDLGLLHHYLGIQFKQCDGGEADQDQKVSIMAAPAASHGLETQLQARDLTCLLPAFLAINISSEGADTSSNGRLNAADCRSEAERIICDGDQRQAENDQIIPMEDQNLDNMIDELLTYDLNMDVESAHIMQINEMQGNINENSFRNAQDISHFQTETQEYFSRIEATYNLIMDGSADIMIDSKNREILDYAEDSRSEAAQYGLEDHMMTLATDFIMSSSDVNMNEPADNDTIQVIDSSVNNKNDPSLGIFLVSNMVETHCESAAVVIEPQRPPCINSCFWQLESNIVMPTLSPAAASSQTKSMTDYIEADNTANYMHASMLFDCYHVQAGIQLGSTDQIVFGDAVLQDIIKKLDAEAAGTAQDSGKKRGSTAEDGKLVTEDGHALMATTE
ncbi:hypothetical protein L7F22_038355 [Adiantum nelumboides]|nr:hypothetical protein [Adiantum nelumboides]